jgi:hypothetical protein
LTNQAATDAVITPTRDIPTNISNTAKNRPSVVVGYLSPYPTVVTVVIAHHSPSPKFLILEPSLKTILEGHRGDVEVIAQALKAEISYLLHGINLKVFWGNS